MLGPARGHEPADLRGLAQAIAEALGGKRVESREHEALGRRRGAHEVQVEAGPPVAFECAGEAQQQRRLAGAGRAREEEWGTALGAGAKLSFEVRARDLGRAHRSRSGIFTPRSRATSCARSYPASTWRITPVPGSVVSTRSSFCAASGVPSATTTIPAWIE